MNLEKILEPRTIANTLLDVSVGVYETAARIAATPITRERLITAGAYTIGLPFEVSILAGSVSPEPIAAIVQMFIGCGYIIGVGALFKDGNFVGPVIDPLLAITILGAGMQTTIAYEQNLARLRK